MTSKPSIWVGADERRRIPFWAWAGGCAGVGFLCVLPLVIAAVVLLSMRAGARVGPESPAPTIVITRVTLSAVELTPALPTETPPPAAPENTPEATATDTPPQTRPAATQSPTDAEAELALAAERQEIEANVAEIRGLEPKRPVSPSALSQAELRTRLEQDLAEDYGPEEARKDVLVLSAFDLLAPDFDLYNFTLDLYTEQIAGFYDTETDEFVIISDDDTFDPIEKITHAHEFVHALQDQYYDLDLLDDESLDSEASMALTALAEGDATLVQTLYLLQGYLSQQELMEVLSGIGELDMSVLESAPPIIARSLEFPYSAGMTFVQALYDQGGFEAVDEAWHNPPVSTEQILHPDRYLEGDQPHIVSIIPLTDTLGPGWERLDQDWLGEFQLREVLAQQLPDAQVDLAATGWGGDQYEVYWHEEAEQLVMILRQSWDTPADSDEFAAAYAGYLDRRFRSGGREQADGGTCWQGAEVICLYRPGAETLIVRAPDLSTAAAVAAVQPE